MYQVNHTPTSTKQTEARGPDGVSPAFSHFSHLRRPIKLSPTPTPSTAPKNTRSPLVARGGGDEDIRLAGFDFLDRAYVQFDQFDQLLLRESGRHALATKTGKEGIRLRLGTPTVPIEDPPAFRTYSTLSPRPNEEEILRVAEEEAERYDRSKLNM